MSEPDYGAIEVPETPTTDEEIAALPVLDLDEWQHAETAMTDLEQETGDQRSEYYTQGPTNWIPVLATDLFALSERLVAVERDRDEAQRALERFCDYVEMARHPYPALTQLAEEGRNVLAFSVAGSKAKT